jgi:Tfp pilus assembly protein PilN
MKAVNLVPADRTVTRGVSTAAAPRKPLLIVGGVLGAVAFAGLMTAVLSSNSSVSTKKKQLEALQSQISSIPVSGTAAATSARAQAITGIVANRLVWDHFLATLSKVTPEDVWLQNMSVLTGGAAAKLQAAQAAAAAALVAAQAASSKSASTAPPAPVAPAAVTSTFTVTGFTYSQPSVARLMRRLDIVPWLTDVSLVSSSKSAIGSDTVFQFTLKATVDPTPVGA